ncbi:tetratricopeptide (TPR) repeat protein [Mesorhizobium soli]|nr:tetratricopeptide (TPR) repeat protein [Mesorhizobium soli]
MAAGTMSASAQSKLPERGDPLAPPPSTDPAFPTTPKDQAVPRAPVTLDSLFADLKRERNEKAAARIAGRIQSRWDHSGSASVDLMMGWAQKAMAEHKFDVALDFLDQIVTLAPEYAEGWNRRATVHFLMQSYAKSMADIEHTLVLEPRHFGAMAGLAVIMEMRGRKQLALEAWQKVLDVYPMMRNAQSRVTALSEDLAGEAI